MRLIRQDVLTHAGSRNKPLREWVAEWTDTVINSSWSSLGELRRTYPSADGVTLRSGIVVTVFNVKGNAYRLLAWINYSKQVVEVLELCTHSEYDKNLWKQRY